MVPHCLEQQASTQDPQPVQLQCTDLSIAITNFAQVPHATKICTH